MWVVVVFLKENSIAVVPKCWLMKDNTICTWPPVPDVKKHVQKCMEPQANWHLFGVRVLGDGKTYDNYLKARNAARTAEETSDINSESDYGKLKRKRKGKVISSDNDTDSCSSDENDAAQALFPSLPQALAGTTNCKVVLYEGEKLETVGTPSSKRDTAVTPKSICTLSSKGDTPVTSKSRDTQKRDVTPNTENQSEESLLQRISRQNSIIIFKLKNLESDVASIMKDLTNKVDDGMTESVFQFNIPVKSIRELKNLEAFLQVGDNYSNFVTFVKKIGGMNPYECVKRTLSRVMTDEVGSVLCWNGTKTKEAFVGTSVQKGLTAGIQANNSQATEKDVEEAVKSWLRHAKSRLTNRK